MAVYKNRHSRFCTSNRSGKIAPVLAGVKKMPRYETRPALPSIPGFLVPGFILVLLVAVPPVAALNWANTTADDTIIVGYYNSIALDTSNYPHISYYNATSQTLKYAVYNGTSWTNETVDNSGDVGQYSSIALNNINFPRISYYDVTNGDLKYAAWMGSVWSIETVDSTGDVGQYSSITLDTSNYPHISYYDTTNGDLKYAAWNGSAWNTGTVDSTGDVGQYSSITLDTSNYPRISYYDATNGDLKYAAWNGSAWNTGTVDSTGDVGRGGSLALVSGSGNPRISYYNATAQTLKYATYSGTSWTNETIESIGNLGYRTSLALDTSNYPHISYYDGTNFNPKYAVSDGLFWHTETVDNSHFSGAGFFSSLALDSSGNPRISYEKDDYLYSATGSSTGATIASFSATPVYGNSPLTVQFNDTSTNTPLYWYWSFGDGNTSTLQNPSHVYSALGTYTVSLNATNAAGSDTTIKSSYIAVSDVLGNFSWTCNATVPFRVDFHSTSTTSFPPIVSLWWSFGDGATDLPDNTDPMHTYANASPMNVTLQVWDALNVENDAVYTVTPCDLPYISATVDHSTGPVGTVFTIMGTNTYGDSPGYYTNIFVTNATTGGSLPYDGVRPDNFGINTITGNNLTIHQAPVLFSGWSYAWDTANISGGSLLPGSEYTFYLVNETLNRSSLYPGTYTVVQVGIEGLVHADYAVSPVSGTAPLTVTFSDRSTGIPKVYNLSFGDGSWFNTTYMSSVSHSYSTAGTFSPVLYVNNSISSDSGTNTTYPYITVSTPSGGDGGGGGDSDGDSSGGAIPAPAAVPPAAQPPAVPLASNPGAPAYGAFESFPVGFIGMSYNADGLGNLDISLAAAKAAGATVTTYFNRVEVYQHHSPGVLITFWGDHFTLGNGSVTGPVTKAEFITDPLNATLAIGKVSGSVHAVLPELTQRTFMNNTISGNVSAGTRDRFEEILNRNNLDLGSIAYTLDVKKINLTTGPANITLTLPATWVNLHGGISAVHITRISDDTGQTELVSTEYVGLDSRDNMIFRGDSPNGTSLFGLLTAEATATAQKEHPNETYVPASKPAMITNVGMFGWLAGIISENPVLLAGIIILIALVAYFGWWRRRL